MGKVIATVVAIVVVGLLAFFGFRYWQSREVDTGAGNAAPTQAISAPPPQTHFPLPAAPAAAETPLPDLAGSDGPLSTALADLVGVDGFRRLFLPDELIRRFVATVDNLPRAGAAARLAPLRPLGGTTPLTQNGDRPTIAPANGARYGATVNALTRIDTDRLVALYVHYYPLFQQQYEALGYPKGYFNDRVVAAIDDMLAAPQPVGTPQVDNAHVLLRYADPDLEARSAGQKLMMRVGADNESRLKSKLRAIRAELTRTGGPGEAVPSGGPAVDKK